MTDIATLFLEMYVPLVAAALALAAAALSMTLGARARSSLGLGLLILTAVIAPFHLGTAAGGLSVPLLLAGALCAAWLVERLVWKGVALDRSRVVLAAAAFMAVSVLSFVAGQYPWFPTPPAPMRAQLGGLGLFLLSGAVFLLVGHQVRSLAQLRRLTWLFLAAGTVQVVGLIAGWPDVTVGPVGVTSSESVGAMFFVWLVAMAASQGIHNRDLPAPVRLAALAAAGLTLVRGVALTSSWASGWLPPLVTLALVLVARLPRIATGAVLLSAAPAMLFGDRVLAFLLEGESYSWMTRVEAVRVMLEVVAFNPWLGFGPANYHAYTLLFPFLGWWAQFSSHNTYLDLVAQVGVVGLAVFLWFVAEIFALAARLRSRVTGGFARAYVIGVRAGLAGSLVAALLADWIVPFAYNIGPRGFRSSVLFWFFLGGLLALKRLFAPAALVPPAARRAALPPRAAGRLQAPGAAW